MIIVLGGKAGAGKSTIARMIAQRMQLKHYSIGDLQREIAREKGISLMELSKLEEEDPFIDKMLDGKQKTLGEREDDFVIDGRLSAHFIPQAIKVFVDAEKEERARRVLQDNRKGESARNIREMMRQMEEREESERRRYRKYYDYDPYDTSVYDLVIDSTNKDPEKIIGEVVSFLDQFR